MRSASEGHSQTGSGEVGQKAWRLIDASLAQAGGTVCCINMNQQVLSCAWVKKIRRLGTGTQGQVRSVT